MTALVLALLTALPPGSLVKEIVNTAGERARLVDEPRSTPIIVAIDEDDVSEGNAALTAKDTVGLEKLANRGRILNRHAAYRPWIPVPPDPPEPK